MLSKLTGYFDRVFPPGGRKRSAALLSAATLYAYGMTMIAGVIVARILLPSEYAIKVLVFSIANVGVDIVDLGLSSVILKNASRLPAGKARRLVSGATVAVTVLSVLFYGAIFSLSGVFEGIYSAKLAAFLGIICLANVARAAAFPSVYWNSRKDFTRLSNAALAYGTVYFALTVLGALTLGLLGVFLAALASSVFQAGFQYPGFRLGNPDFRQVLHDIPAGMYVAAQKLSVYGLQNADKLILGAFVEMEALGLYAAASIPLVPMTLVSIVVGMVVVPDLSAAIGKRDFSEAKRLFAKTLKYSLLSSVGIAIGCAALFFLLTQFFLRNYVGANYFVWPLAVPFVIESAISVNSFSFLLSAGLEKRALLLRLLQLGFFLVCAFLLVPAYGVWGAVAAVFASSIFGAVGLHSECRKFLRAH